MIRQCLRCLVAGLLCCLPAPLFAQISFQWETRRQDTLYQTVEDCLGLNFQAWGRTVDWDTTAVELGRRVASNTINDTATAVARHCSQKFSFDSLIASASTDPAAPLNAVRLLIKAKRDTDAIVFVERWTAKLPQTEDTLRVFIRDQVVEYFLDDKPTRFTAIRRLADSLDFTKFWETQVIIYGKMMERAQALKDTAELNRTVAWLLEVNQRVGDSIKKLPGWAGRPGLGRRSPISFIFEAITYSERVALLDKLRQSTSSYLDFLNTLRQKAGAKGPMRDEALAKPILADYWFPATPTADRPTRGKVAVVILKPKNECNPCWYRENMWGRIAKRFPEVEFTLLARTHGAYNTYFGALSSLEEARLIDSIHRQVYGFPGAVAIYDTKWWRFEEPYDRRVVEEPGPNEDQYPLFRPSFGDIVIDRHGRIIPAVRLSIEEEESMTLLIEALSNQAAP